MLHARAYTAVDTDKFDVGADYGELCRSYDRMKHAREFGLGSEIELREGFDELFRLVFRDHPELKEEDDYWYIPLHYFPCVIESYSVIQGWNYH